MNDEYDYEAIRQLLGRIDADEVAELRAQLTNEREE